MRAFVIASTITLGGTVAALTLALLLGTVIFP